MNSISERESAITQIAGSDEWVAALRAHVHEIVEGEAFKGSHRSGHFLTYIVDQAVDGHFESLKERMIGIELFGSAPPLTTRVKTPLFGSLPVTCGSACCSTMASTARFRVSHYPPSRIVYPRDSPRAAEQNGQPVLSEKNIRSRRTRSTGSPSAIQLPDSRQRPHQ